MDRNDHPPNGDVRMSLNSHLGFYSVISTCDLRRGAGHLGIALA